MPRGIEDETFPPRYNAYQCIICRERYLTIDLARGVTAEFMECLRTEGCGGQAISLQYPPKVLALHIPLLVEWVKPDDEELARVTNPSLLNYFAHGGLMRRACDTAPEWVKQLV